MNWGILGAAVMFLGVALGAFAAHGLKHKLDANMLAVFETGVRYQMYHALMLFVIASYAGRDRAFVWAGDFYLAGILLFSGSLYVLALVGSTNYSPLLGAITPIGGLCFLVGHALLAYAFWRLG